MIGIDTNLLVRLLTNDDKQQARYAANLIEHHLIFIPKTVLLETEWVLRYTYHLTANIIFSAFNKLINLENITVEDLTSVLQALAWYEKGFDFADALHLAACQKLEKFATLDKIFIKKIKKFANHLKVF